ncbi:PP2C family serine/threonine-protein phosphatase [Candidatus Protochlamydia sp. R18]|uniref:PP2C family serine/threonine-protein phosphatase n=1 Tax=Candidatus Protochlamydia sp. R18 TaxID=1353977 RepID=UPI0005A6C538|nr:PP2C family protein-serine/threonine phosphatase [Candidatus Protochlamydia sp. R18]
MLELSLAAHPKGYELNKTELCQSLLFHPYAVRHYELFRQTDKAGHLFIAFLESIPMAGVVISIIERIIVIATQLSKNHLYSTNSTNQIFLSNAIKREKGNKKLAVFVETKGLNSNSTTENSSILLSEALSLPAHTAVELKMIKNLKKAIFEHKLVEKIEDASEIAKELTRPLRAIAENVKFSVTSAAEQGCFRPTMEDAHFHLSLPDGELLGVFDGHGENGQVAHYVSERVQKLFVERKSDSEDMIEVFKKLFKDIHQEVITKKIDSINGKLVGGSTAVVCYVCRKTLKTVVATLGDSEVWHFRQRKALIKATPLSCVRKWSSKKDFKRINTYCQQHLGRLTLSRDFKSISLKGAGTLQPSRSIGDRQFCSDQAIPLVSQEPIVSMIQLQQGDRLIVACDGVWNFLTKQMNQLIETVIQHTWDNEQMNIAQEIANFALSKHNDYDNDNVSVISLRID